MLLFLRSPLSILCAFSPKSPLLMFLSSTKALSMLSATSCPRQSPTADNTVDHVRGDAPVPFDPVSQHSNISRQHNFRSYDSVALKVFKMAISIPKCTPICSHSWAITGTTFFSRSTAVGLLLRSLPLTGSTEGEGVGVTVMEGRKLVTCL